MGNFTIFKGSNGQFYFNLKASNGEPILQSEGYPQKHSCKEGIESVKINCLLDSRFHRKTSGNEQFYFVLVASNEQPVCVSEMYKSKQMMEHGIQSVQKNAPTAIIADLCLHVF